MGIRIGVTDGNREFFDRFRSVLMEEYRNEFEVYLFPDLPKALKAADLFRIRIILLEPGSISPEEYEELPIPDDVAILRLADRMQTEKQWEQERERQIALAEKGVRVDPGPAFERIPVLCRFRSAEEWRALLLQFAPEKEPDAVDRVRPDTSGDGATGARSRNCRVVLFTSAAGGVGVTTAARAFAECCLHHRRRVLYLNLECFPGLSEGRQGDDLYTLEDVLLAMRGRRYQPDAVLERALLSEDGECATLRPPADPTSVFDMTGEEIVTLIDLLRDTDRFSILVIDLPFDVSERIVLPVLNTDRTVLVTSGAPIANRKTRELIDRLPALCNEEALSLYERICLLYNRYQDGRGEVFSAEEPLKLGGIGELDFTLTEDLIGEIADSPAMERLYEKLTQG